MPISRRSAHYCIVHCVECKPGKVAGQVCSRASKRKFCATPCTAAAAVVIIITVVVVVVVVKQQQFRVCVCCVRTSFHARERKRNSKCCKVCRAWIKILSSHFVIYFWCASLP